MDHALIYAPDHPGDRTVLIVDGAELEALTALAEGRRPSDAAAAVRVRRALKSAHALMFRAAVEDGLGRAIPVVT